MGGLFLLFSAENAVKFPIKILTEPQPDGIINKTIDAYFRESGVII